MRKTELGKVEQMLLRDIISRREPSAMEIVDLLGKAPLAEEEREWLREILSDELCEFGLKADDEPNDLGRRIDDLIGQLMLI